MKALLVLLILVGCSTMDEPSAVCNTDSDCMFHCPPPADDPECDGGPEQ
jgi:hypothetical protein